MAKKESGNSDLHESRSVEISEPVFTLIFSYFLESSIMQNFICLFLNISRLSTSQKLSFKSYNLFMVANLKIWTLQNLHPHDLRLMIRRKGKILRLERLQFLSYFEFSQSVYSRTVFSLSLFNCTSSFILGAFVWYWMFS